ncbi:hypothetical protein ACFV6W_42625, partial [Streptomyces sp. NPDC059802]
MPRSRRGPWSAAALLASLTVVAAGQPATAHPVRPHAGRTYYVAVSGQDAADGRSDRTPFRHIQKCADVMVPGDTCLVLSGTYEETVVPARSGTAGLPITYRAAPGAKVTVSGASGIGGFEPVTAADVTEIAKTDPFAADSQFGDAVAAGHIYSTDVDLGSDVSTVQVFTDKRMGIEAQWPYPGLDLLDPSLQYGGGGRGGAPPQTHPPRPGGGGALVRGASQP